MLKLSAEVLLVCGVVMSVDVGVFGNCRWHPVMLVSPLWFLQPSRQYMNAQLQLCMVCVIVGLVPPRVGSTTAAAIQLLDGEIWFPKTSPSRTIRSMWPPQGSVIAPVLTQTEKVKRCLSIRDPR